jgi:ABC-type transport system substrate-binding protein
MCPPANYNISYFANEEYDNLIHAALETADQDERNKLYAQAQDIVWAELPIVPLANSFNTWATAKNMQNVKIYKDGAINIRNAKLAAGE